MTEGGLSQAELALIAGIANEQAYFNIHIQCSPVGKSEPSYCLEDVPEPSTWAMMLVGLAGLGYAGYRRAKGLRAA